MRHGSLFTGIGGFDLAAEWMGWTNTFQCEIDPFCQKVLAKNFPNADRHTDIKQFNATAYRGTIDVLSGGFPCQPFSLAGQRKGNSDDRALWPEMLRVIDEVRPRWIVGENVAGLVSLGLDSVLFDLEASGYSVETVLLPACSVGAPHRRDRLWIIAHAERLQGQQRSEPAMQWGWPNQAQQTRMGSSSEMVANTTGKRRDQYEAQCFGDAAKEPRHSSYSRASHGEVFRLTEPPLRGSDDGLPAGLVRVSTRAKQLKAYGNSIVPQVAYEIFKALKTAETLAPTVAV